MNYSLLKRKLFKTRPNCILVNSILINSIMKNTVCIFKGKVNDQKYSIFCYLFFFLSFLV